MKIKQISLGLILLGLVGCSGPAPSEQPSPIKPVSEVTPSESPSEAASVLPSEEPSAAPSIFDTFPETNDFRTPAAYLTSYSNKFSYQAKVSGKYAYVRMIQNISGYTESAADSTDLAASHIRVRIINDAFANNAKGSVDFMVLNNGKVVNDDEINATIHTDVTKTNKKITYLIIVEANAEFVTPVKMKFFSFDETTKKQYGEGDFVDSINKTIYHTHIGDGWCVKDSIGFLDESLYETPEDCQSAAPDKWGYAVSCQKEGIYVYSYQIDDSIVDSYGGDDGWKRNHHVEYSFWQHNFGMGAQYGFDVDTYIAVFSNGDTYINNSQNLLGSDLQIAKTKLDNGKEKIEYRLYLSFENNFDNPSDKPYTFICVRAFDPNDNSTPYNPKDYVSYRDDRFIHKNRGNSAFVEEKVKYMDDNFTGEWATLRKNKAQQVGLGNNTTLFIGDSYLEYDNWWTSFFDNTSGKDAFSTAIGGTRIDQWLNEIWYETLIKDYNPKQIVIHLGYNDILGSTASGTVLSNLYKQMVEMIHNKLPETKIFVMSCEKTPYMQELGNFARIDAFNQGLETLCFENSYLTFADTGSICLADKYGYNTSNNTWGVDSFFKDKTHPRNEMYPLYLEKLAEAGCVLADK